MIGLRLAATLCFAVTLAGCNGSGELDRLTRGEAGRVTEVRAGDAFVTETGLVVRLAGVEAPHGADPGAAEARDALARLVQGQQVVLFYGGAHRDRYDRAIAQVKVLKGGAWVQKALLDDGRVRVHTWPDNAALAHSLLTAEAKARMAGKGLWALPDYRIMLPSEAKGAPRFAVLEGRVSKISADRGPLWLDFAEGGVEAKIPAGARSSFQVAGTDFQSLAGRIVRVRGWLAGGVLTLDHPAALEQVSG
jgi:endonuclease YncB( thermonuclease family)